jgi:hypothetical protein
MRRGARALCALAVLSATIAAGGPSVAASDTRDAVSARTSASPSAAPQSEASAQADAAALLTELELPAGSTPSSTEPSGDGGHLAHPGEGPPASPNAVDEHTWWIVPGTAADVRAYIQAHLASAATLSWGSLTTDSLTELEFTTISQLELSDTAGPGQLVVSLVPLPGESTALRADAQVVWVTPRPVTEEIPPGARLLRITVTSSIPENQPRQRPLLIVSRRRIDAIVALLNALPAEQPGVRSCPDDPGIRVRLALYARRGAAPLALATVDPYGCGGVHLSIGGKAEPGLEGGGMLVDRIDSPLGSKLNISPPQQH